MQLVADSLLPQLEIYLGNTGSDMQERKRLMNLLENLRGHGYQAPNPSPHLHH